MANKTLKDAKSNKNDEFYTRIEDISEELNNYKKHFKNKIVLCNCDDPEWSNFWIFFHQNFEEFGLKKLISTHYNRDGSSSYVMEYTGGNDVDPKDWHQHSLKGNGDFASEECIELLKEADIVATNPPFSLFRKYLSLLMEYKKKFLIIGNKNALTYKEVFPLIKENKLWLGYNSPEDFLQPDGVEKKIMKGLTRWFTNLDIPKRHIKLIPTLKYEFANHPELYQKYDNYDAINIDKVKDIPYDYYEAMGVPITFIDKYNPDEFEIINLDRYVEDNPKFGYRFTIGCKETYARILIRRKLKRGEREAKVILEQLGLSFNPCYYDNAENDSNPDFQYSDGRFLEITHTKHNFSNIKKPNKFSLLSLEERIMICNKAKEANDRYFSGDYPYDEKGHITEEGKKQRREDEKLIKKHFGLDNESSEKADISCYHFDSENIFEMIEKKNKKHLDKDLDLFIFAQDDEIDLFMQNLINDKKSVTNRLKNTCFKKIYICSFNFDECKYDKCNYVLIEIDNINGTNKVIYKGVANEDRRNKN